MISNASSLCKFFYKSIRVGTGAVGEESESRCGSSSSKMMRLSNTGVKCLSEIEKRFVKP
jgi:hypothetical protein